MRRTSGQTLRAAVAGVAAFVSFAEPARAVLTFTVGGTWDSESRRTAAVNAMQQVVDRYNAYGNFGNYNVYVYYNSGIPTAQASYLGSIGFGGTWPNERVTMHELAHYLGSGTYGDPWNGPRGEALVDQFDGIEASLSGDSQHFWPYGLNYDSEGSEINKQRQVALMYAQRIDMGIGSTANPTAWAATAVTLTASDAMGESGFNFTSKWSDRSFAHPNADYSTGNFTLRTPDSANSFTFAGKSLTVNNSGNAANGLYFKGSNSNAVITIRNLAVDGGTFHNFASNGTAFQLAGDLTVLSPSTIHSEQGPTTILAPIAGSADLTIGTTNAHVVRFASPANTFTGNLTVNGRFELAGGATHRFEVGEPGVNNVIRGPSAAQVSLNGTFDLDLSRASDNYGDSWTLVTSASTTYGRTFGLSGFWLSGGRWINGSGYAFSTATGKLSVFAEKVRWTGAASANLSDGGSWATAAAPAFGNILRFGPAGAAGTVLTDDLMTRASHTLTAITFTDDAPAYTLNPANPGTSGFRLLGALANHSSNIQTINDTIELAGQQSAVTASANGGDLALNGPVSGTGGITKNGAGTLALSAANSYSGATRVDAGTLLVTGSLNPASALTVAGGHFRYSGPAGQSLASLTVLAGPSTVTNANPTATLDLGPTVTRATAGTVHFVRTGPITTAAPNTNGILGPWAFTGSGASTAYVTNYAGTLAPYAGATTVSTNGAFGGIPSGDNSTVNYYVAPSATLATMGVARSVNTIHYAGPGGTQAINNGGASLTINGFLTTGTGTLVFDGPVIAGIDRDLIVNTATSNLTLNGTLQNNPAGASALTKVGPGTLTLNGANTYSGPTTVSDGILVAGNGAAFGAGPVTLSGGRLGSSVAVTLANTVTVNGAATLGWASQAGNLTLAGALVGDGTLSNFVGSSADYNVLFTGTLSGFTGALVHTADAGSATGSWRFGASGSTADLSRAAVTLNKGNVTNATALGRNFGFADGISGATLKLGSLSGDGPFRASFNSAGPNTLEVGSLHASATFSGVIAGGGGGTHLALAKTGGGTWTLTGANAYTGSTTVSGGTLVLGLAAQASVVNSPGFANVLDGRLVFDYTGSPGTPSNLRSLLTASATTAAAFTTGQFRATTDATHTLGYRDDVAAATFTVMYTHYGDLDLDGSVDADDYVLLDRGFVMGLSGWVNGDVDYSGTIDQQDYLLTDAAYIHQGAPMSPEFLALREAQFGSDYAAALAAAVPEPGTLGLAVAALAAAGLPRRRRPQTSSVPPQDRHPSTSNIEGT